MDEIKLIEIADNVLHQMDSHNVRYLHDDRGVRAAIAEYCEPRRITVQGGDLDYIEEYIKDDFESALHA